MYRVRVGEINRTRVFEEATVKIPEETRACADLNRNPVAIAVLIAISSDVP